MSVLIYLLLTVAVFAALGLTLKLVETVSSAGAVQEAQAIRRGCADESR